MRVAWALVVSWCMVLATTAPPSRDAHRAGISTVSAAPHHVARHRTALAPFVAPDVVSLLAATRTTSFERSIATAAVADLAFVPAVARGPPLG